MSNDPTMPDDIVDRAAAALRDTRIPPGPPAAVVENTLGELRRTAEPSLTLAPARRLGLSASWRIAASVLVLLGVSAAVMWVMSSSPRTAFADVLRTVRQVRSVRFTQRWIDPAGTAASAEVLLVDPARMRVEHVAGPGAGSITIMSLAQRKGIALLPGKHAFELSLNDDPRSRKRLKDFESRNLLEHFRLWQEREATLVEDTVLAGTSAVVFRITRSDQDVTLWVDPDTRLPIRMLMRQPTGKGKANELVFENFRWNEGYDDAALSLTPPAGYVLERFPLDLAEPSEADLIEALRTFAELRGGTFPDDLSLMGLLMSANRIAATKPANVRPTQQQHVTRAMAIGRGLLFAGDIDYGYDWHYAGMGVQLDTPDRAILWYRPARSERYRVIFADLSTREMEAEELPMVESIPITRSMDTKPRIRLP